MNTNTMNNDVNNSRQSHFAFIAGVVSALAVVAIIGFAFCVGMWFAGKKERNNDKEKIGAIQRDIHDAYDKVQLWEGGPYWADRNIGAEKPEDYGYYFWWGDTVGYKREGHKWVAAKGYNTNFLFSFENAPTNGKSILELDREGWIEEKNGTDVLTSNHDAAQAYLGGAWRMPTKDEFDDLLSKCDWTWTTRNGKNGYVVRGRGNYASKSIFLPAAGSGGEAWMCGSGSLGGYWSSVPRSDNLCAYVLGFDSSNRSTDNLSGFRVQVRSVRPLQGFTK